MRRRTLDTLRAPAFHEPLANLARGLAAVPFIVAAACSIDARQVTVDSGVVESRICKGAPVDQDVITDFSDAVEATDAGGNPIIRWGGGPGQRGGVSYVFGAAGQMPPALSLEDVAGNRVLRVRATPGVPNSPDNFWSGLALGFGHDPAGCVDASAYRGVRFRIEGTVGTCQLMFQVEISQDLAIGGTDDEVAACTLGDLCYPPFSTPLSIQGSKTYEVPFTAISEGSPVHEVDPRSVTDVGWKLWAPLAGAPCEASFVVDDVAFFR